ncbi:AVAST type 3 anti-phage nuclease/ATPase Avs3a [Aureliella helgolandensis]|uniref:NACHT domain protein n=1 Tax=Aureliella helgolandensis TaxID=2527968 RepID=A0A518GBJ3_9BACT|nr:AVAST type 3 anti-phage nuclease/ATPase Avs3a [Aureliella helgolandensis]QDV25965.1 NACHT domain protein [Aureliella helgolandensis]
MSNANLVRYSRDGDQFHYLWAARHCLQLLSSESDLVSISIEGPSPNERQGEPPTDVGEEVIDIAEYFGSENIRDARLIRYMQLKHSTQRSSEPWTASGLQKTVEGFAKRYKDLLQSFPADGLAAKLQFWFVTNRPIGSDFTDTVADAAARVAARNPNEFNKLERFVGLHGDELTAFSKLLHFKGRQDDYWDQRNILFQEVSGYLPGADVDAPTQLKELVTRRALSEGESNPIITKTDVLRALKTDEGRLFPANCQIEILDSAIPRAQEANLIRKIVEAQSPVIVHASAGVGKTVFATRISRGLPDGSTGILFDCFGNGQYRNSLGYRHRHKDALVQIANELAAKGLCHLLIPTDHDDVSSYMRAFIHRLKQAATKVRLANANGLLCLVVDAADNAQMAAEEIGESRSFVRDLIRTKVPDNVRLVFLCRSHRQNALDPPVESICCELEPFSRDETAAHLRQTFAEANEHDIGEFHGLSSHNPRVQALALSRNNALSETLRLLGPNPTTVDDTIGSLLEGAIAKLKDNIGPIEKVQIDKLCAGLAVMRPLVPIPILSQMSGVDEGAIKSFAVDLGRPLLVAGDTIQFLDEPAETWFREKFKPSTDEMEGYIAGLTPLAKTSAYAASVLPQLLLESGRFSELVELALTSAALPETSPLEKRDVELQRLQFALKACLRIQRHLDAAKLALKAGGEMAGDDRSRRLLQANTDLAAAFLDSELIQELVSRRTFGSGWIGAHHAYEASLLSGRRELLGDARSRLRMAYEWLRNWSQLPSNEREDEKVSDEDIVELTLADINIHGPESGAHNLRSWRPRDVAFRVGKLVTRRLIDHGRFNEVEALAQAAGNNLCLVLAIAVELRRVQCTPPINVTQRALRLVANSRIKLSDGHAWDDRESALNAVTAIVEAGLQLGTSTNIEASEILSRYLPADPPRVLASRFSKAGVPILRAYCLRAALQNQVLALRDLAHSELRAEIDKENQHSRSSDLQEFQEDIGALLPWYQLWASTLIGRVTKATLEDELKRTRQASNSAGKDSYRDDFHTSNEIALLWLDVLHRLDAVDSKTLAAFTEWKSGLKRPLFTPTLTTLARLCGQKESTKANAIDFAIEAFNLTKEERADAESKSEGYINAARSILLVSRTDAAAFFNEAVEVASKIGDENLGRWDSILDLADRAARCDRPSPETAYHFARCAELTYDYVVRDKHFNWEATIEALCGLCPASTLAILSRWRDRGFGSSERILPIAITQLIKGGVLGARDALPLIGFRANWRYDQLLDSALSECASIDESADTAAYVFRYMKFSGGDFSAVMRCTSKHGIELNDLDEITEFEEAKRLVVQRRESEAATELMSYTQAPPAWTWDAVFSSHNLAEPDGLVLAYRNFRKMETPWIHENFFKEAIARVPAGSEALFIEAFANVPDFELFHLREFLEVALIGWKDRPATRLALETTLKVFCRRYCMHVAKNRHYEVMPFTTACTLAGINESELVDAVLDAVGQSSALANSDRLFSLVGLLATKLSEDEALETLDFGLHLLTPILEDRDGDGPWSNELLPPTDTKVALAGYIWTSMAAPEAALRWEGSHVVLGLATLGRQDLISHIFNYAIKRQGVPFVDARLPFYGLHAFQWFLIGVARAATEFPEAFVPFADQIVDWAIKDQTHVLIRLLAARSALALMNNGGLADKNGLKDRLVNINQSPYPIVDSKTYDRGRTKTKVQTPTSDDDRFYFGFDIGPYWYAPIGEVFALSQDEIESEALKIIRNSFGSKASGRSDDDERSKRGLYEEGHTLHSHGSYPRVDNLHFYYSYHAMMMVAGNLLASTPTYRDSEYGEIDKFADRLDRHDLSRGDGRWLWDRRDPVPVARYSWQDRTKDDGTDYRITSDDFDEALNIGGMLNVWGTWTTTDSKFEQSNRVYSALVTPDKSHSLLRALGTAGNVYDYAIPNAGSDMEIDKFGFALKGWVVDHCRDQGLDGMDRWSGGISFPPPSPARFVVDLMSVTADLDDRFWRNSAASVVMASKVWGQYDEAKRHESSNPERGSLLQATLDFVVDLLARLGRDLIIEVQIDRRRQRRPYESSLENDNERIPTKAKLYLLGTDGQFRTL